MHVSAKRTGLFRPRTDLAAFIVSHLPHIEDRTVLVIASKIVSLAEGRLCAKGTAAEFDALVRTESSRALQTSLAWLTLKEGMLLPNAGIDESNGDGKLVLLPLDCYRSARLIRHTLLKHYGIADLGIIVADSTVLPLRAGTVGTALGYAGFRGVREYRGTRDIFGRPYTMTRANVADALAAAAVLSMGEGREQRPLAVIKGAPVSFVERGRRNELKIPLETDLFGPLLRGLK